MYNIVETDKTFDEAAIALEYGFALSYFGLYRK